MLLPLTIIGGLALMYSSYLGQMDYKNYETKFFYFISGIGVIGSFYHNILLDDSQHDQSIFYASIFIWFSPYLLLYPLGVYKWNPIMD
jgi:thiosulfate reductase cytochrome b subunit